jgi:opacity protein-like surface antigen
MVRHATSCLLALMLSSTAAVAQTRESPVNVTAFTGAATTPDPHAAMGVAVGVRPRPLPVSLEFEYSRSRGDSTAGVPAVVTFAGNLLVQLPLRSSRLQVYGTVGVGLYRLSLDRHGSEPNDARNVGGGVKVALFGPLKLRVDYRAFRLAPIVGEYHSNEHRVYAGIVAGF